jgi:8-oxo-dGTP diphosphatase
MQNYVLGFAFTEDYAGFNRVMLIQKLKPEWQAGKLNGIGGKIELGETPHRAMAREFFEEAGLASLPTAWLKFAELEFPDCRIYCFTTRWEWKIFKRAYSKTEEKIRSLQIDEAFFQKLADANAIENLHWLIPAANAAWWLPGGPVYQVTENLQTVKFEDPKSV